MVNKHDAEITAIDSKEIIFPPGEGIIEHICCDCGLTHQITYHPLKEGGFTLVFNRDDSATQLNRISPGSPGQPLIVQYPPMGRTLTEIEKDMGELQSDIIRRFLKRTPLGDMMTHRDSKKFERLVREYTHVIKERK